MGYPGSPPPSRHLATLAALLLALAACSGPGSPQPAHRATVTGPARPATRPAATATPLAPGQVAITPASTRPPSATPSSSPVPTGARLPTATSSAWPATRTPAASPRTPTTVVTVPSGQVASVVQFHEVSAAAWSPTGDTLAVASLSDLHLVNPQASAERRSIPAGVRVTTLAFHPDGRILAAGTSANTIQLWDAQTLRLLRTVDGPNQPLPEAAYSPAASQLTDVAFSRDGSLLAASVQGYYSGGTGSVWLWRASTGERLQILGTYGAAQRVEFAPDGTILAATLAQTCARRGGGISLWANIADQAPRTLSTQGNSVLDLALQPRGQRVAGVSNHGDPCPGPRVVRIWDVATGAEQRLLQATAELTCVAYSPDGALLAGGDQAGAIHLWDAESGRLLRALAGHGAAVSGVAFSPRGRVLASWGADGTVRLQAYP